MRSKNTLEATNRITEAEDRISELQDRMVEINESERINEKRIKRNEHNLIDLQDNIKRYNVNDCAECWSNQRSFGLRKNLEVPGCNLKKKRERGTF